MSTRGSIMYAEFSQKISLHIYKEMNDDYYYIENESGVRIRIPTKEIAILFAEVLKQESQEAKANPLVDPRLRCKA